VLEVRGERTHAYTLQRDESSWQLLAGAAAAPAARVSLAEQTAWLLLTKGMPGAEVRDRATLAGDAALLSV